jgi:mono/diheme cytochrome c family protein
MRLAVHLLPCVLAAIAAIAPLQAQDSGDTRHGLVLARQVCSDCHAIQAEQLQSPNPRAPTFPQLATTPGVTNTALTVALTTPHAGMPMFRLTAEQRTDLIAYILSLRQTGSTPGK